MPMAAALSANHLAAVLLPPALRRLYIARDALRAALHLQLAPRDVVRFMRRETAGTTRRDSSLAWSSETP